MLNPSLDIDALSAQYRTEHRIRIGNILEDAVAERVLAICSTAAPFEFAYFLDGS